MLAKLKVTLVKSDLVLIMLRTLILLILISTRFRSRAVEPITFCYEEWTPYAYRDNGKSTGEIIERLLRDLQSRSMTAEFYEYPFSRCILEVREGRIDFTLFVDPNDNVQVIDHNIVNWQLAVVSTSEILSKNGFLTSDSRVIISNEYVYPKDVKLLLDKHNKQVFPTSYFVTNELETKALFNLIIKQHAEQMVVDRIWAQNLIKKYKLAVFVSEWNLTSVPQYIGYSEHTKQSKIDLVNSVLVSWPKIK